MKRQIFKIIAWVFLSLLFSLFLAWFFYHWTLQGYQNKSITFESELAESLMIFEYNQSQHKDPVSDCWYDSGDYIVVLPRNTEALFYLSLAYRYAQLEVTKNDLKQVIDQQLVCVEKMLTLNFKQFRDQASHGFNMPPFFNEHFYPSDSYFFRDEEGADVFLMLSLVHDNLGNTEQSLVYKGRVENKGLTSSDSCCEWGPLVLEDMEWKALQGLADIENSSLPEHRWGIQFPSLLSLKRGDFDSVEGLLSFVESEWKGQAWPFEYLGGNYDIAGTIALERLYAEATGDDSYRELSDDLYAYLVGDNDYDFDFTQADELYHPCSFFKVCELKDTLINGIYEEGQVEIEKNWQTREVQLVGQAQYVLMKVLYFEL